MFTVHRTTAACSVLAFALLSASASADDGAQAADQHFRAGVSAYQQRSWAIAAREFEAAFEASPHHAVLYNLGLAYAALGRPADAVVAFERYLREGGAQIPPQRQESVRAAIAENQKKLGSLVISVSPEGADVSIDGRHVDVGQPHLLTVGAHTILAEAKGRNIGKRTVEIRAGAREEVQLALEPETPPADGQRTAALRIACRVPGVRVDVDGQPRRFGDVLLVGSGVRRVAFVRDGYESDEQELTLAPGEVRDITCNLRIRKDLPAAQKARLVIRPSRPDATTHVDGSAHRDGNIPFGVHRISVACDQCATWSREVKLAPGETRTVSANLDLSPSARAELEDERSRKQRWMWITGGTGLALGATAVVLFAVNQGRASDWQAEGDRLGAALSAANPPDQSIVVQSLAHDNEALSIQRTSDIALGTAIVGGALLGIATYLYLSTEPVPPRPGASNAAFQRGRWTTFAW